MSNPEWKHTQTAQKRIRIIKVNRTERHLDALDMDEGIPICIDANANIDLGKIKQAKIYQATINTYQAQLTSELERMLKERALQDPKLNHSLQVLKATGSTLKRYELTSIKS